MQNLNLSLIESLLTNRMSTYAFLSRLCRIEADQELLDRILALEFSSTEGIPEIDEGYRILHGYVEKAGENTLTELAVDYAKIFLGVQSQLGIYPYESVYTSKEKLIMQEARDQVVQLYRQEGLDRAADYREPEDHIALELEFMAYLSQKTIDALQDGEGEEVVRFLEKQKLFLEEHLMNWVPAFCEDMEQIAQTDFYTATAKITKGFLALEDGLVGDLIQEIESGD
ncbi:MAG: molecular chaperone TorD family protein [Anaerolineales bacterium]|nr:molecular chaperone TorD family protein [Anaerolineales bacterium]